MAESPDAVAAFEAYWELGEERTLAKLAEKLNRQLTVLKRWSAAHCWQERVARRIEEEAAQRRRKLRKRAERLCERVMTGIEADVVRYLDGLLKRPNDPQLVTSLDNLEQAMELFMKLAGEPLAEAVTAEVTVRTDGPISDLITDLVGDPEMRRLALQVVARASGGSAQPGQPGDEADGGAVEVPEAPAGPQ